jgi:hypothetical protein
MRKKVARNKHSSLFCVDASDLEKGVYVGLQAAMLVGAIIVPAGAGGTLLGGYLVIRLYIYNPRLAS